MHSKFYVTYFNVKLTRIAVYVGTGTPSFFPGSNCHCSTASRALSSSP